MVGGATIEAKQVSSKSVPVPKSDLTQKEKTSWPKKQPPATAVFERHDGNHGFRFHPYKEKHPTPFGLEPGLWGTPNIEGMD